LLREGDTLVVWKLDRLGRSVKHLVDLVGELHKQGVQFRSLTDVIDTATPSGRFFFHVMGSARVPAEEKAIVGQGAKKQICSSVLRNRMWIRMACMDAFGPLGPS
jgi:hypothetical protein